ncbi:hypothetical protein Taro_019874 [Colocasia esculenta]|uniref:Alpha-ketoglutarate-dependent dioxygenase AlkB-like domain-containing protein n=1 Tax=Colocasia esculenta TaxID=4460 RepID=A0A843UY08_COLES|nr:hypothetical protein [Colocasia esculenta]
MPPKACPIKLNPSLLQQNREKRKERKQAKISNQNMRLQPGMILLKNFFKYNDQVEIIRQCQRLGVGSGGFYQPGYVDGAKLSLQMMCLGKNWDPLTSLYEDTRRVDGAKAPQIPDKDEGHESLDRGLPVVSFSLGDTADFLYGDSGDLNKAKSIRLENGDVLIFGGHSRHIFHGVPCIHPSTAPRWLVEETGLRPGRLNLTFRQF